MKNQKGFSLIELLIVVVIIGIIAAIAIPNLLAARRSANEGSAISSLRTIHGGEMTFQATKGAGEYGTLMELATEGIVDEVLGAQNEDSAKSGYLYTITPEPSATGVNPAYFDASAKPMVFDGVAATGTRSFYVGEIGVIWYNLTNTAPTSNFTDRAVAEGEVLGNK